MKTSTQPTDQSDPGEGVSQEMMVVENPFGAAI